MVEDMEEARGQGHLEKEEVVGQGRFDQEDVEGQGQMEKEIKGQGHVEKENEGHGHVEKEVRGQDNVQDDGTSTRSRSPWEHVVQPVDAHRTYSLLVPGLLLYPQGNEVGRPRNKEDSRPRHLQGKGCKHGLVRQTWPFPLFGPM